jgi:tetratricopeptide (TPR) repeat protein
MLAPLTVTLVAAGLLQVHWAASPLRFTLDGHEPAGDYLMSEAGRPRQVDFSDGSSLVLRSSGRLRVGRTDSKGATLLLERGQLDASIRHRRSSHWRLDVGPYAVHVTGTRFNVTWDPDGSNLAVALLDGAVDIRGPGISAPITLQAGQQFRANKAGGYTVERQAQAAPAPPAIEPPAPEPVAAEPKGKRVGGAAGPERGAPPSTHNRPRCDWAGLVSKGQFEATVSKARALSVETALADCPPRSLFALADAARYMSNFDLSKAALLAIRERSPDDLSKAAFFLGRLEEARGNLKSALGWYSEAMEGAREHHFVQEAKAGRARIVKRMRTLDSQPSTAAP